MERVIWLTTLFCIAYADMKQYRIPNKSLIFLIILKLSFYLLEIFLFYPNFKLHIADDLIGCILGFFLFFVLYMITRGSIGAGDVKLAGILGLYLGGKDILPCLIFAFFLAGFCCIVLLVLKQISRKDALPFAPFLWLSALMITLSQVVV